MIESVQLWGEALLPWMVTVKAGLITLLTYLVWSIKSNHLPHIYDKLGELHDDIVQVKSDLSTHDKWERSTLIRRAPRRRKRAKTKGS